MYLVNFLWKLVWTKILLRREESLLVSHKDEVGILEKYHKLRRTYMWHS